MAIQVRANREPKTANVARLKTAKYAIAPKDAVGIPATVAYELLRTFEQPPVTVHFTLLPDKCCTVR